MQSWNQKYQLTGVHDPCTPVNWPKDSQKHDLDPLADKKFYWDSSQVSRDNYAHKYDLTKPQRRAPWIGPLTCGNYSQKYDLTKVPTAGNLVNWHSDSKKLRSKVAIEQVRFRNELYKLIPWLEKTTLKSILWPVYMQHVHPWIGQRILISGGDYDED